MNIVHIYSTAGVSGTLARYQRRLGHEVKVIDNRDCDGACFYEYGGVISIPDKSYGWGDTVEYARRLSGWADVFHVHSLPYDIARVKEYAGNKPIILHLHGLTDVNKVTRGVKNDCSMIIAAFPSIWRSWMEYLPNPVDLELWHRREHTGNNAFWFKQWNNPEYDEAEREVMKVNSVKLKLNLTVINRYANLIRFMDMQQHYDRYGCMVEFKPTDYGNNVKGRTLGLAALEALACGLPVYFLPEDAWIKEFPMEHEAAAVVKRLDELYGKVV